ncbi:MAG: hypothetical protein ABFS86_11320, partial [Planctomycetota bacterium]
MKAPPVILMTTLVLSVLACQSPGPNGPLTTEADEAYRAGDFERAYELYSDRYEQRKDPLVAEKMNLAWARAHGSPAVDPEEAAARIRSAKNLIERADRMAVQGRPVDALKSYRAAQEYVPGYPEAREGEVHAEKMISDEAIGRARSFERQGQAGAALGALDEARAIIGEPFDPATDPLSLADAEIRGRIATALLDRAKAELAADRPSTALLFAAAWLSVTGAPAEGPHPEPVNEILLRFARANTRWVHVGEVEDGTDGLVDGATFERLFLAAWEESGQTEIRLTPDVEEADLALDLSVDSLSVETSTPVTKSKRKEFVIATEALPNPKLEKLRKERDRLDEDLGVARSVAADARKEYDAVRRLEGDAEIHARYSRLYGHYSRAAFYRHLANARTRNAKAKRRVDGLTDARDEVLAKIDAAPPVVFRETRARATVEETVQTKTAVAAGSFRLTRLEGADATTGEKGSAQSKETAKDSGWPGLEDEGIPEEPLVLPPDGDLADVVLARLAVRMAK